MEILGPKLTAARTREQVCHTCSIDPTNQLIDAQRDHDAGLAPPGRSISGSGPRSPPPRPWRTSWSPWSPGSPAAPAGGAKRRLIPVRADLTPPDRL